MNYIITDFEYNQPYNFENKCKGVPLNNCNFEIIQIGSIKLNKDFNIIAKQNLYVKPTLYKKMHPHVEKLTGITDDLLQKGEYFPDAVEHFVDFLGNKDFTLCFWGSSDILELFRNINYYKLNLNLFPREYVNVQVLASKHLKHPFGKNIGLKKAVEAMNIPQNLDYHNALNDAFYTAKIFSTLSTSKFYKEKISLRFLKETSPNSSNKIDFSDIYKLAEKELGRKLSGKEKRLFQKIYFLGKASTYGS